MSNSGTHRQKPCFSKINTLTAGLTSQFASEHVAHNKRAMRATIVRATIITLLFHFDKRRSTCVSRSLFPTSFVIKRIGELQIQS